MGHKVRYKGGPSNFEKQWNNESPECFYLVSPEPQNPPPTENLSKFCLGELDNFFLFFFLGTMIICFDNPCKGESESRSGK